VWVDGRFVAVEVKTRVGDDPMVQLTSGKRRRMVVAARSLQPRPARIDAVTVCLRHDGATVRWLKGIT
jgi:Holliday junction resolvase-like predicted endonuclease